MYEISYNKLKFLPIPTYTHLCKHQYFNDIKILLYKLTLNIYMNLTDF